MTTGAAGAQAPEPADDGNSPGRMLRRQREQRGFSLQDVADELHLDRWVIETIEADRFLALGAPVYARGHLRKYALLLEVDPEIVLGRYESLSEGMRVAPPPAVAPVVAATSSDKRSSVWIAMGALAVGIAALAIWKVAEPPPEERPARRQVRAVAPQAPVAETIVAPSVAPSEPPPVAAAIPAEAVAAVAEPAPAAPEPAASPAAVTQDPVSPPVETELVELELAFTEASWVEVYDAAGGKLMFDIGQPGSPRTLSGSAPLTVLLGKADAVQVTADGQPIVVPRRAGRDAARFTVAAGGAVR